MKHPLRLVRRRWYDGADANDVMCVVLLVIMTLGVIAVVVAS